MAVAFAGAVYAAAANITVNSTNLGAGEDVVAACDTAISVSFGPVAWEPAIGSYKITTVTVDGIAQPACNSSHFRMQLTQAGGAALGTEEDITTIGSQFLLGFDFSSQNLKAEDVEDVHIALYGP